MNTEEIIRAIHESKKTTPVKVYVKEKQAVDYAGCKVFGEGKSKIVFGDWNVVKDVLASNADKP